MTQQQMMAEMMQTWNAMCAPMGRDEVKAAWQAAWEAQRYNTAPGQLPTTPSARETRQDVHRRRVAAWGF